MPYTRGQRLELARKDCGLTQQELSTKSRVSQRVISELENEKRPNISAKIIYRLAKALGITVEYLEEGPHYEGDEDPASVAVIDIVTTLDGSTD